MTPERLYELFFEHLKKFLYPEKWVELDLSFSKSELLTLLLADKEEQVIMSQIAEYINLPMSTATGIVERLVKGGYLTRERRDEDRRLVVVALSEQGKAFVSELKEMIFSYIRVVTEALTQDEQEFLFSVFMKIVQALRSVKDDGPQREDDKRQIKRIEIE